MRKRSAPPIVAEHREQGILLTGVRETRIVYAYEDDNVEDAAALMKDRQIRRLAIVDREKKMTGILALADVASGAVPESTKA